MQNTMLLSLLEMRRHKLQKIYINMANSQEGRSLENLAPRTIGIVATPGNVPQGSDGGT